MQEYDLLPVIEAIATAQSVVLQFPNREVNTAIRVQRVLTKAHPAVEFFILSDHLKPDCCVDMVGAQHIKFDLLVHFGPACFSTVDARVLHVLPKWPLDVNAVHATLQQLSDSYLLLDQGYENQLPAHSLTQIVPNPKAGVSVGLGYYCQEQLQPKQLVFVGTDDSKLLQRFLFQMGYFFTKVVLVDAEGRISHLPLNLTSELVKRSHYIEKAKSCKCFGLLVSNPSAQFVKETLGKCQNMIQVAERKSFIFTMNNLSESKLGNFPEIDCFVVIACHNTVLIDEKQYYKLAITPFELQCALDPEWTYNTSIKSDISQLDYKELAVIKEQTSTQLMLNKGELQEVSKLFQTLSFYQGQTYQGIVQEKDKAPSVAKIGLTGIATNYRQV